MDYTKKCFMPEVTVPASTPSPMMSVVKKPCCSLKVAGQALVTAVSGQGTGASAGVGMTRPAGAPLTGKGCVCSLSQVGQAALPVRRYARIPGVEMVPYRGPTALPPYATATLKSQSLVPAGYGIVVLTAIGSGFLMGWLAWNVSKAREELNVPYPTWYSEDNMLFNCIQRGHLNAMESYPYALAFLLIGGLDMPIFTSIGAMIWMAGRVAYAKGYYTGNPQHRAHGNFGLLGMVIMAVTTGRFALDHLW